MKIEWSEPAADDLFNLRSYIARDSRDYAERFVQKLLESVELLVAFPDMGRRVPETDDPAVRELIHKNYRIIYRVEPGRILLLGVLHGGRDLFHASPKPWEIK